MIIRAETPREALDAVASYVRLELVLCENASPATRGRRDINHGRRSAFEDVAAFVRDAVIEPRS
jgi:hypothetical protein